MKTNKMKKVLIALDYDPTAQKVAEEGFSLAKAMNAKVILLHVIADSTYYSALEYSRVAGFMGFSDADAFTLLYRYLSSQLKNTTNVKNINTNIFTIRHVRQKAKLFTSVLVLNYYILINRKYERI